SVMFEVAVCVMAYTVILWIEFSPAFLERFGFKNLRQKLFKFLFIIIAIGVLLPTMHQSSLGTLAVVFGHQVSPLWQTQLLPILFLLSALMMGYAIVPFESILASMGFQRVTETPLLGKLSRFMLVILISYLVIRVGDMTVRGAWAYAFEGTLDAFMFWVEMALFIVPLFFMLNKSNHTNTRMIFISALMLLFAGSIYRMNVYLIGYHPGPDWSYFPSLAELMITIGMFSFEVVLYLIFVKTLPVLHRAEAT
ncbi:NrfD/PsrC family molybdoenzyme membrane anchor subunit, partial [Kaarinaea lacus]